MNRLGKRNSARMYCFVSVHPTRPVASGSGVDDTGPKGWSSGKEDHSAQISHTKIENAWLNQRARRTVML
jgi:hypothetical protein